MTGIEEADEIEENRESNASKEIDTTLQPTKQQEDNETLYIIEGIFQEAVESIEAYQKRAGDLITLKAALVEILKEHQEICCLVNRLEEAVNDLDKIISLSGNDHARIQASYYHLKGRVLCNLEKYDLAYGPLLKAFELLKTHTKSLIAA